MRTITWTLAAVALAVLASCESLGKQGDTCITPQDCEIGLNCGGGKCTASDVTCGEGTEDVSGICRPLSRIRCGSGTFEQDGTCLPEQLDASVEPDAAADAGPTDAGPTDAGAD